MSSMSGKSAPGSDDRSTASGLPPASRSRVITTTCSLRSRSSAAAVRRPAGSTSAEIGSTLDAPPCATQLGREPVGAREDHASTVGLADERPSGPSDDPAQKTVALELSERLPDGHPADAERLGEAAAREGGASPAASRPEAIAAASCSAIATCSGLEPRSSVRSKGRIHSPQPIPFRSLTSRPFGPLERQRPGSAETLKPRSTTTDISSHAAHKSLAEARRAREPRCRGDRGCRRLLALPLKRSGSSRSRAPGTK